MDPQLAPRLRRVVASHTGVDADRLGDPGTTVAADERQDATGWITLWPAEPHVVVQVPAPLVDVVAAAVADHPSDHLLAADDLAAAWPGRELEVERDPFTVLEPSSFRPTAPQDGAHVRRLGETDRAAFETFLAACPRADREEADVDVGHGLAAGVLIDERIVAVASVYTWCGFDDIGVLTAPDRRRRGHGAAAVSAVCRELVDRPGVACYRFDPANTGSQRVAEALGLVSIGPLVRLRPAPRT